MDWEKLAVVERTFDVIGWVVATMLVWAAVLTFWVAVTAPPVPCDTDTDCVSKNGGDW